MELRNVVKKKRGIDNMSSKMKERLHTGEIYLPGDDEILEEQFQCQEKLYDYNQTRPSEGEKRSKLLKEMFAEIGDGCYIEPPLRANWGGHFVHFGKNIYANSGECGGSGKSMQSHEGDWRT